ncbi:uncharacterized protein LOC133294987 [Gastrolobium bilobum]|uniref:uncharacterized protein LOC133294987 n=1 Tax=Gastrolobium bilobum TaxID=150636 RepID=UPI002AAF6F0E|nr:uncharacterized protein LOC133294987 [Gastrolobium bilobum]
MTQLSTQSSYSFENDFLKETEKKSISDVKLCVEVTTCITYGTIKAIESKYNWWYKSCKKCPFSVYEDFEKWYCKNCQKHWENYYPRFSVQVRVVDNTDSASFILFDRDCVSLLGMSAAELRELHFKRGADLDQFPNELNVLNEKSMLFKINVKQKDLNTNSEPKYQVSKICISEDIISAFIKSLIDPNDEANFDNARENEVVSSELEKAAVSYEFDLDSYAILTEESIKSITLKEIDKVLQSNGKCLSDYPSMPRINSETLLDMQNRLVLDELMYDRFALEEEHKRLINSLTDEQKAVYDKIVSAVTAGNGGLFFLYGFGGTGKTFIWNTLSASIRSKAGIVLNVASSGIASLLLPGGRTAHSRFRIPIQINEDSMCNIRPKSTIAELLSKTKLIIWDEAPMVHRFCFEALDRTLRDVLRISDTSCVDMPFGGKVVVLGGDFRQILPVIPHGSRQDIVHATINSSHLWSHCHLLTLTKNMRLNSGSSAHNLEEIKEFSEWLLKVGDGNLGDDVDGESIITIPDELLIRESEDPLSDMVNFVYPNLLDNILDQTFFKERAILTPKLSDVAMLNEHLMSMIPGEERTFLSSDKILKQGGTSSVEDDEITPEILNTLSC